MVSHSDVINNYFNAGDREHYNHGANVYFDGDKLYSYGTHFILAIETKTGYLLNGDTYSHSTSQHQACARGEAPRKTPVIPFSALRSMIDNKTKGYGDFASELIKIKTIDVDEDIYETVTRKDKNGNPYKAQIHHLGGSLIEYKGKRYLSSIDNTGKGQSTYFIVMLKDKPDTVQAAFRSLADNLTDDEYEQYQDGIIKRQGEYFLIPTTDTSNIKRNLKHKVNLSKRGNAHIARDYLKVFDNIFIRGTLRHRQHKMVSMGNVWHKVVKNTAGRSWGASGNVD